jgi:hypothetical protein
MQQDTAGLALSCSTCTAYQHPVGPSHVLHLQCTTHSTVRLSQLPQQYNLPF